MASLQLVITSYQDQWSAVILCSSSALRVPRHMFQISLRFLLSTIANLDFLLTTEDDASLLLVDVLPETSIPYWTWQKVWVNGMRLPQDAGYKNRCAPCIDAKSILAIPFLLFAHFQTMCPWLYVQHWTATNNKVQGLRESPPPLCSMAVCARAWQICFRAGDLTAAMVALPLLQCRDRQGV